MEIYAGIQHGIVVCSNIQEHLTVPSKKYEVDYIDQLVLQNGSIVVDKTQPNKIEVYKQLARDQSRLSEIKQIISDYVAEKELYTNGIIDSMSMTEDEYKNLLLEFKDLKDKLS